MLVIDIHKPPETLLVVFDESKTLARVSQSLRSFIREPLTQTLQTDWDLLPYASLT